MLRRQMQRQGPTSLAETSQVDFGHAPYSLTISALSSTSRTTYQLLLIGHLFLLERITEFISIELLHSST